jgi:hypothetical protein
VGLTFWMDQGSRSGLRCWDCTLTPPRKVRPILLPVICCHFICFIGPATAYVA